MKALRKAPLFLLFLILVNSCDINQTKALDVVLKEVIKENNTMIVLKTTSNGKTSTLTLTVQSAVRNDFTYGKILLSMFEKLRAKNVIFEKYKINDGKVDKIASSVSVMNQVSTKFKLYTSHLKLLKENQFSLFQNHLSPEIKLAMENAESRTKFESMDYSQMLTFEGLHFFNQNNKEYVMFVNSHEPNDIRLTYDLSEKENKIIGIQMN